MELKVKKINFLFCIHVKGKKINFLFYIHTTFYIFYSSCISFSFLHVFLLVTSPSLLSSSTNPSFFLYRPIADLHEPSRHKPIATDPRSTTNVTHLGPFSLSSTFWVCVLSWVFVSGMGFGLAVLIFLLSFFCSSSLVLMGTVGL